jgi:AcrR family transcriptional regulator
MPDLSEPPKRRRGRPSTGGREAIVDAALELLADQGLARLTTRAVARRAGVSEASVYYHYRDKVGLIEAVVLAGLAPLKGIDTGSLAGREGEPLDKTLRGIGAALESFFDRALPVLEMVQADATLRVEFAGRLADRDLGPHRGVRFVREYLTEMKELGLVNPHVDTEAAALLLVGGCFLRSWQRRLTGGRPDHSLPSLDDTVRTLADLLAPGVELHA